VLNRTPYQLLQSVKCAGWLFDGIAERTMLRGEGWQFLQCGKFLERAEVDGAPAWMASRTLSSRRTTFRGSGGPAPMDRAAQVRGAYEAFRKTRGRFTPDEIIAFVLLKRPLPGAIRYSIAEVDEALRAITRRDGAEDGNEAEAVRGPADGLPHATPARGGRHTLHEYLTHLVEECANLHDAVVRTFFSHLAWRPWETETEAGSNQPPRKKMAGALFRPIGRVDPCSCASITRPRIDTPRP